jgi:hypothetical protein
LTGSLFSRKPCEFCNVSQMTLALSGHQKQSLCPWKRYYPLCRHWRTPTKRRRRGWQFKGTRKQEEGGCSRKRQRGLAEPCSCAAQPDDEGWCAQGSRWVGLCVPVCNVCILHARQQVGGNGSVWMLFFVLFWK